MRTQDIHRRVAFRFTVPIAVSVATLALLLGISGGAAWASAGEVVILNEFGNEVVGGQFGVAVDQNTGDVYLGNTALPAREHPTNTFLFQFTPTSVTEPAAFPTEVGSIGPGEGELEGATGIAVDSGASPSKIYVLDAENPRIEAFNAQTLAYESQFPVNTGTAVNIAVDAGGVIYLPVPEANEVQELTSTGAPAMPSIKGSGPNELVEPTRVAVDNSGDAYVIDHPAGVGQVEKFDARGEFQSIIDSGESDAIAVDPSNNDLWVVDGPIGGEMVHVYDPTGALIAQTAKTSVLGPSANVRNIAVYGATHEAFATVAGEGHMARLEAVIPAKPGVEDQSVGGNTQTSARIEAKINPSTLATTYEFQYGVSTDYSEIIPSPQGFVGSDSINHRVTAELLNLFPNSTYHFRAVAENALGSTEGPDETFLTSPATPTTGEATKASPTGSTLTGSFDPGGHDTRFYFQYGTTPCGPTTCGATTQEEDAGDGTTVVEPAIAITSLLPLTEYYYRMVVTNTEASGGGTAYGEERGFFTPIAPVAVTEPPLSVGAGGADLQGEVIPDGAPSSYRFDYGTTSSYGAIAPTGEGDAGSAATGGLVTATLTNLEPDTEYHYRLVATNSVGEAAGSDFTFTTNAVGGVGLPVPVAFSLTGTAPVGPTSSAFPNLAGVAPQPITAVSRTSRKSNPKAPSCEAKAERIKNARKRKLALKLCRKVKRKGGKQ